MAGDHTTLVLSSAQRLTYSDWGAIGDGMGYRACLEQLAFAIGNRAQLGAVDSNMRLQMDDDIRKMNLGTRTPKFPPALSCRQLGTSAIRRERSADAVDVLLVNPPSPDGGIWIRSQHRVGRKSRENMIWPQVSLAQLAALLSMDYKVESSTPSLND
jgi:hypothetical protein